MNSVWVCQKQGWTSHLRPPDSDYEPESMSSFCLSMGLQLEFPKEYPPHICIHFSPTFISIFYAWSWSGSFPPARDNMVDNAAVKHPLSLAVTEPRGAMVHIDPSGKDKATGCSKCLKNFLLKCKCGCEGWQLLGWRWMWLQTRNDYKQSRKNIPNWNMTGQGHHYGSVQLLRVLWAKCWLEGGLENRRKKWYKRFLWEMLYSRQGKLGPSLSVLIFGVWVQMSYWRRQKGKQQEKQAT